MMRLAPDKTGTKNALVRALQPVNENPSLNQPRALSVIGDMRGCARAKLVECDDGYAYVVKFANNPQKRRSLVNEVITSELLAYLGLPVPMWRPVRIEESFLRKNPIVLRASAIRVIPGQHFGSRYCGWGISGSVVYDWLPTSLLREIRPMPEFVGVYVVDQWVSNRDTRQAIFYRKRSRAWNVAFIDHGYAFGGSSWDFVNSFGWGNYADPVVYRHVRSFEEVERWISRVAAVPDHVFTNVSRSVPGEWTEGDEDALQRLMTRFAERRRKLGDIVERLVRHPRSPFPIRSA